MAGCLPNTPGVSHCGISASPVFILIQADYQAKGSNIRSFVNIMSKDSASVYRGSAAITQSAAQLIRTGL